MITNFAFSYCGWANNSTVTLSLPPGRHDLVILEDYYWGFQVFYHLRFELLLVNLAVAGRILV